jgi:hypothetical protein
MTEDKGRVALYLVPKNARVDIGAEDGNGLAGGTGVFCGGIKSVLVEWLNPNPREQGPIP